MFKRSLRLLWFACLVISTSWAANNPFVGDWKLDPSRSTLTDRMKVESAGGNKYIFDFGGGQETIAVDGTDQSSQLYRGVTLSVAMEGDTWKVIRKQNGRMLLSAIWSLSPDGNTLTDRFTGFGAGGSPYTVKYVYQRKAPGGGFAGTWLSTSAEAVNFVFGVQIQPYQEDGLSVIDASSQLTGDMKFDASSIRTVDENTLELMRKKSDGELSVVLQLKLSPDRKTLTITPHTAPGTEPHLLVFERQ